MSTERRRCPRCRGEVVVGRTESGFDVELDDVELHPRGELDAALAGIKTVTHHLHADTLAARSPFQIRTAPAGTRPRVAIRPVHRCPPERTPTP